MVLFREDVLRAVVSAERCAIRASVSEAPAHPGMGTRPPRNARQRARLARPMLPPSPFDALLNAQRFYTAVSLRPPPHTLYIALPYRQASGSTAPRPFINDTVRTRRGLIDGRYEPLTTGARVPPVLSPSYVASIRLSTILSPSPCRFPRLHPRASAPTTPLPPYNDASPAAPSARPPRIRFWRPQANGPNARKVRTLRTTSWSRPRRPPRPAHIHRRVLVRAPSRAITILRPKPSPRAGPVPFLRASGSSAITSSTPPHVTHDPRTSPCLLNGDSTPIRAILCLHNAFTYCRHSAQSPLSSRFHRARRQPPGIPRPDRQHSESHYQPSMSHPPSISRI